MNAEDVKKMNDHIEMGKFYFLNSRFDKAVEEFEKALEINPANAEAYYNIGLIKESANDPAQAKEMYSKALSIDADYKIAREKLNKLMGIEDEQH